MADDKLTEIISTCILIDQMASDIYSRLSESCQKELKAFWFHMAEEEKEHVLFWKELLILAERHVLPDVFPDPDTVLAEVKKVHEKVVLLFESSKKITDTGQAFLVAYRLELYVLHPAFLQLFHFIKVPLSVKNPEDQYETHINEFIEALTRYGEVTPELELLGETLQHLWKENRILAVQSSYDELTGIFNRRGFLNILKPLMYLAQRSNSTVGIIMADIDDFKRVNDKYGHQKGDEVLRRVAQILKQSIRTSDIVGRYGGEEFIIYFPSVQPEHALDVVEKLRKKVEVAAGTGPGVTISLGMSCGILRNKLEEETTALIAKADACLYEAKKAGKNRAVLANCDGS